MSFEGWLQAGALVIAVVLITKPLGVYMAAVFEGETTFASPLLGPIERGWYRLLRIDAAAEMTALQYLFAVFAFSAVGLAYLYALLRLQAYLPFNPQHFGNLPPDLAWNTAVSFLTNTNWQFYSGESTLGYLAQMAGLAWHNFVSAAVGIAIAIAVMRGVTSNGRATLGNFWADLTRGLLYVLLPISLAGGLVLAWQGVPQNLHRYATARTIDHATQTIPQGPIASQEIIKELGTNGGGFVNANSASPDENPTGFTNFLEMLAILAISAGLTATYGRYARDERQGWAIFVAMALLLGVGFAGTYAAEAAGNPIVQHLGLTGGNLEGKECRFGVAASSLFATVTTDTSCGAVNAMHDSFTPLGGLVTLVDMQLGEVVFGGVGTGLYGMLVFVVLTVFIAGLMVGRTPELLGKKIERKEIQLVILAALVLPVLALVPTAVSVLLPVARAQLLNAGPHGFSEMLYMFTSTTENNGSAFAGVSGNTYLDVATGIVMFLGRYLFIVPIVVMAGSLAGKRSVAATSGTFSTSSPIFVALLLGTIVIVGALTFVPADALGPIAEQLSMQHGVTY